jgi:hypothetical protein
MIQIGDETYLLAAEAARHLQVSRPKFYRSYKQKLESVPVGEMSRFYYRVSDLNQLLVAKPVKTARKAS